MVGHSYHNYGNLFVNVREFNRLLLRNDNNLRVFLLSHLKIIFLFVMVSGLAGIRLNVLSPLVLDVLLEVNLCRLRLNRNFMLSCAGKKMLAFALR